MYHSTVANNMGYSINCYDFISLLLRICSAKFSHMYDERGQPCLMPLLIKNLEKVILLKTQLETSSYKVFIQLKMSCPKIREPKH